MAFYLLATYAIFFSMCTFYITDGDVSKLRFVMWGASMAGIGAWFAIFLARRKKDGRQ